MANTPFYALPALLLLAAGCHYGPIERFDSDAFTRVPEIWEKDGGYHLRLFEKPREPVGMGAPAVETVNGDIHVYIWARHSAGSHPNLIFDLGIKASSPPPRFFWRDPDGTLHPLELVRR